MTTYLATRTRLPRLRISTSHAEGASVVQVGGEVDSASAPELEAAVASAIELDAADDDVGLPADRELILDLRAVTFFASAGLRELLTGSRLAASHRLRLRVVASSSVLRALEVAAIAPEALAVVPATAWRAPKS